MAILIGHVNGLATLNPVDFCIILYMVSSTLARQFYCVESLQHPGRGEGCHIQDNGKVTLCTAKCTMSVTDIAVGHSLCLDIA